jgi:pimeloyl-ACP methyl ester carboxylesterase
MPTQSSNTPALPAPSLTRRDVEGRPKGLVLMLHGGKANGLTAVDDSSASWRRSRWMMDHVAGRLNRAGASVWLLRYGVSGWNGGVGPTPSPVPDAPWGLDEVRRELGDLPVVLLGHSMGGRTAVAVADDANVVGVVTVAPWLPPDEPNAGLAGKPFAAAHGRSDRITSFRQTRAFARNAEGVASSVELHDMGRVGHYMFRSIPAWNAFAVSRSLAQLGACVDA